MLAGLRGPEIYWGGEGKRKEKKEKLTISILALLLATVIVSTQNKEHNLG